MVTHCAECGELVYPNRSIKVKHPDMKEAELCTWGCVGCYAIRRLEAEKEIAEAIGTMRSGKGAT